MTSIITLIIALTLGTFNMNVQETQQIDNSVKTSDVSTRGIGWGENGGSVTTPPTGRP